LGIDLGGTKILALAARPDGTPSRGQARRPREHEGGATPTAPRKSAIQIVRFIIVTVLTLTLAACSEPTPTPTIFGGPHRLLWERHTPHPATLWQYDTTYTVEHAP
ncbi:MAG: hypothetical protein OXK79_09535, partial [Chloroflexota bacterium]|nr:hypothetical protein [Chloroflexota bacterium]